MYIECCQRNCRKLLFYTGICLLPGMSDLIEYVMERGNYMVKPVLDDYVATDREIRIVAEEWVRTNGK